MQRKRRIKGEKTECNRSGLKWQKERKKEEERELKLRKKYKGSYPEGKSQGGERSGKRRNRAITRETKGARAPHR